MVFLVLSISPAAVVGPCESYGLLVCIGSEISWVAYKVRARFLSSGAVLWPIFARRVFHVMDRAYFSISASCLICVFNVPE